MLTVEASTSLPSMDEGDDGRDANVGEVLDGDEQLARGRVVDAAADVHGGNAEVDGLAADADELDRRGDGVERRRAGELAVAHEDDLGIGDVSREGVGELERLVDFGARVGDGDAVKGQAQGILVVGERGGDARMGGEGHEHHGVAGRHVVDDVV